MPPMLPVVVATVGALVHGGVDKYRSGASVESRWLVGQRTAPRHPLRGGLPSRLVPARVLPQLPAHGRGPRHWPASPGRSAPPSAPLWRRCARASGRGSSRAVTASPPRSSSPSRLTCSLAHPHVGGPYLCINNYHTRHEGLGPVGRADW